MARYVRARVDRADLFRLALIGVFIISLAAFALTGLAIERERERTLRDGAARAGQLALVLEEQTLRTIQAVDLTLQRIVDAVAAAPERPDHDARLEDRLRTKRDQLPFVRALFVIGADGFISQDTDHPHTPWVTLADRPYFRLHRDGAAVGLHIGPPLMSRSVNRWFVSMSRRIDDGQGRFAGVAVAAVEPRYFEGFYEKLGLGESDSIALFHRDGTLYWRTPYLEASIGTSFAHLPLFQREVPARTANVYRTTSLVSGVPVTVSYRALEGLPLIVTVGLTERAMLAGWRRMAFGALTATALLVGLVVAVFVLVSRHARQRAEVQERLLQAHKLEALGRMTGGIAHDFGNILNVIAVNLEVLHKLTDRFPGPADKALAAARQGTALASQLLGFARQQQLTIERCDANQLVAALAPLLGQAAGPSIDVKLALSDEVWPCLTDTAQLSSAILNLVLNARDAMPDRKGTIRIATANRARGRSWSGLSDGDYVEVTVSDTGRGMPRDVARRAVEPFYTTKGMGRGTGLGLSQIYGFTHQVGGGLQIDSAEGAGTTVHLFFPRAQAVSEVA